MKKITLKEDWILGDRLGAGGFGQVYAAENRDGLRAAVKLVPKAPGADRELLFVDLKGTRGIVPIIDSGEYGDHWVLVMPRADESLRQHLTRFAGKLSLADTTFSTAGKALPSVGSGRPRHRSSDSRGNPEAPAQTNQRLQ